MTAQTSREGFRVRGESTPVWLPAGLTLVGLIVSIITVRLLLPRSSDGFDPELQRIETTMSSTQVAAPAAKAGLDKAPDASGLADVPEATLGAENNRLPAETDTGFGAVQIPAAPVTPNQPASDTVARGLESVEGSAVGDAAARFAGNRQGLGEQVSSRQTGSGPKPEPDVGAPIPEATNDTPASSESAAGTPIGADPATSILPPTRADAQGDRAPEQLIDKSASDCAPLFSVRFKHASVEPQGRNINKKIKRLAAWLSTHPTAIIYVDGHADASGPEELNLFISFQRAAAIATLLEDAGTSKAQLVIRAYGEGRSLSPPTASAPNRRVALKIDADMGCDARSPEVGGRP
jgi:outer membrane protein OmpA-like peptidoglycan-associated protein